MNPEDLRKKFNFNSKTPTGNGIFGTPASNTANGQPATTLSVPVLSPTHFDSPTPPPQPSATVIQQPSATTSPETPLQRLEKTVKHFKITTIVLGIVAVICLILSVVAFVLDVETNKQLTAARATIKNQSAIISAVQESTGTEINSPSDVPTFRTTHGYIYLDDWSIKLKVPEDLTSVSYIYDQKYRPSICFNGLKKGVQYFPGFADIAQNTGGMGCLRRVEVTEGDADQDGHSFGTRVFTDNKGYNYFYVAPSGVFATDAAEQGLENTAVQIIKTMLSGNNISIYD